MSELMRVLDDVNRGEYVRTMINNTTVDTKNAAAESIQQRPMHMETGSDGRL
jgi:hypothetical protein